MGLVRLPLGMYAVVNAVDEAGGDENAVLSILQDRHGVSMDEAGGLIEASVRVGVVGRAGSA